MLMVFLPRAAADRVRITGTGRTLTIDSADDILGRDAAFAISALVDAQVLDIRDHAAALTRLGSLPSRYMPARRVQLTFLADLRLQDSTPGPVLTIVDDFDHNTAAAVHAALADLHVAQPNFALAG